MINEFSLILLSTMMKRYLVYGILKESERWLIWKKESIIEFLFSTIICVSLSLKDNVVANRIENSKGKINTALKKALNTHEEITDPNVIFELAIEDYKIQFTNYINITALNVFGKEKVDLPNFDLL